MLKGYKTYLLCLAALAYGIGGYFTGHLDFQTALDICWSALAAAAIRHGVTTGA